MNQNESKERTVSREVKRAQFLEREQQSPRRSPLIWLGTAACLLILILIGGFVFFMSQSAVGVAQLSPRIISEAVEVPAAQKVIETDTGPQLVRAATAGHEAYPLVEAQDDVVRLPVSTFSDREAHYYTYVHENESIEFFVLESSDGIVRAAFNACDVCFRAKKGYTQDGNEVICNNCGRRFAAELINEVQGGCNPAPLNRVVQDGYVLIQAKDLVDGLRYF